MTTPTVPLSLSAVDMLQEALLAVQGAEKNFVAIAVGLLDGECVMPSIRLLTHARRLLELSVPE